VYFGCLRKYRFVFKHLPLGTLGKERSIKKKRNVDDFCRGNVRQLIYREYSKSKFILFDKECELEKKFVLKLTC
jgi:hypothetical protein